MNPDPASTRDLIVVGAGAAGLHAALVAAEAGADVCLISRKPLSESASFWAQGGLAAALAADDSPEQHAEDTLAAGRRACRPSAVEVLVSEVPAAVEELRRRGVAFDVETDGGPAVALEGGHSRRRIVHAGGSRTGQFITARLTELAAANPGIDVRENASAVALWSDGGRCHGVVTDSGAIAARATVLATGGGAALWSRTTNPWGAIGAGPVLAHLAGADLADLEFCQFHPTALAAPGNPRDGTLITEAVRGEGAVLLDAAGRRFTDELAPRDAVTAAILDHMGAEESDHVSLDMRTLSAEAFPNVFAALRNAGYDPAASPVPVAPAAHYLIGGVATDLRGRSSLAALYAIGECACTGVHGANRLASNSLSECFVFGRRAAEAALNEGPPDPGAPLPEHRFEPPGEPTRAAMWDDAGPVRDPARLQLLRRDPYPLARAIAECALARRESRGAHRRLDAPRSDPGLDGVHLVYGAGGVLRPERWD